MRRTVHTDSEFATVCLYEYRLMSHFGWCIRIAGRNRIYQARVITRAEPEQELLNHLDKNEDCTGL